MDVKKKRSCNFTNREIGLLMECVMSEIKVIENKKTDGSSLKEKMKAWERVNNTFNSMSNSDVHRDVTSIKNKYENIKRALKKKIAQNRQSITKTGGGPPSESKLLWYEEELFAILQLGIEGLLSEAVNDYNKEIVIEVIEEDEDKLYEADKENQTLPNTAVSCAIRGVNSQSSWQSSGSVAVPSTDASTSKTCKTSENQYLAKTLVCNSIIQHDQATPKNSAQCATPTSSDRSKTPLSNRWNLKRKRSAVPTVDKKKMSLDSFQKLSEGRKELNDIQKQCFEVELELKKYEYKQKIDQWARIKEIEETELNIKLQTLKELTNESDRKKKIFDLTYEKEKITVELMKCELNMKLKKSLDLST
ncbi:hypothetical protein NQ315_014708 [Exocentrus adspersus]|uniref:Regulatory protein zeste n=1 Tax=Exocentrus adspersus TaxID=1586481 RepID=A0AAV8VER4_9CUCU|nr:hypothetical protein NQ315_014708 [Exocentrus adspersus]